MAEATTPTASWASTFQNVLNQVVDVGANVALGTLAAKQQNTVNEQAIQAQAAQASLAAQQAQAVAAAQNPPWLKYAMIGGGALACVVVLSLVLRRR